MNKTPLYECHLAQGAKMVEYAGWNMPVQYEGITAETLAVRNKCGIFDVSHMGEIRVFGEDAGDFLNWLLTRKVTGKKPDIITYAIMCYADGGVVDDLLVYTMSDGYLLVVNAANKDKDLGHIADSVNVYAEKIGKTPDIGVKDLSSEYAQIAVQGPDSIEMIMKVKDLIGLDDNQAEQIKEMKRYRQISVPRVGETPCMILSSTGYTGEKGVEIYGNGKRVAAIWDALLELGVVPCGLGSRDALRLEAGMPLYGHEMTAEINPLDASMGFFVKFDHEFQGDVMKNNNTRKVIRLVGEGKKIAREGYPVYVGEKQVGVIASGSFSPTMGVGIANALVDLNLDPEIKEVEVQIRKNRVPFKVVEKFEY